MANTVDKKIVNRIEKEHGEYSDLYRKVAVAIKNKHPSGYSLPLEKQFTEVASFKSGWNIETDPIEFIVIGAGGTGGYLIRDLCRFVYSVEQRIQGRTNLSITLYDGDIVEEKNILRQNFLPQDIGQNKAEVMANRHARAFGINISYVPEMFKINNDPFSYNSTYDKLRTEKNKKIIIGCVDNNAARREIASCVAKLHQERDLVIREAYWIDSGNEKKSGQVIVGSKDLMDVTDLFPEILLSAEDSQEQVSCADRMLQDEQNMFVNLTAANIILNYTKNIVLDIPMITHGAGFTIDNKIENYYIKHK